MGSPVGFSLRSFVTIERVSKEAIYLQVARQLILAIQKNLLTPGMPLPGSRVLAETLQIHRKTAISIYHELEAQGWIEIIPDRGTFVSQKQPVFQMNYTVQDHLAKRGVSPVTGYVFRASRLLDLPGAASMEGLELTDGSPDTRLAPMDKLTRTIHQILKRPNNRRFLGYSSVEGNKYYRNELSGFLNISRGLSASESNIITTRGTQMGLYLVSSLLLEPGDAVVTGELGNYLSNMVFQKVGAQLHSIPVDHQGISVEAIRALCERKKIRMVYITPHHHYPTTVTLTSERRLELLKLAELYGFIILEDDHDYDFHYDSRPLLPLASVDTAGMVVYVGSFCKSMAPGLRAGYVIGPENLVKALGNMRRIIDRQSDVWMEQGLGELLHEGEIQRHIKKVQKVYHQRRDYFCEILKQEFDEVVTFSPPPGGLACWTTWHKKINLLRLSNECNSAGVSIPQTLLYQSKRFSAMRLGFGNLSFPEMDQVLSVLKEKINKQLHS